MASGSNGGGAGGGKPTRNARRSKMTAAKQRSGKVRGGKQGTIIGGKF